MTEKRADELQKGDVLELKGDRYTVVKVKVRGKHVRLTIDGRRGSFTDEVKARTVYDVVVRQDPGSTGERAGVDFPSGGRGRGNSSTSVSGPLFIEGVPVADLVVPFDGARNVVEVLGGRLVGVEDSGGRLVVPPVSDATLLGHLLTMHSIRWDGVTVAEAKAWAKANPGRPDSMADVLDALGLQKAYELHEGLHRNLLDMPTPHWHEAVKA